MVAIAWIGWLRGLDSLTLDVLSLTLVALDTGGFPWFILSMAIYALFGTKDDGA